MRVRVEPTTVPVIVTAASPQREADGHEIAVDEAPIEEIDGAFLIEIRGVRVRYRFHARREATTDLTILVLADHGRLFLGGGRRSCVIDLDRRVVEHTFDHWQFWGFDRLTRPGFVLETGELDALFRAPDGRILGHVPVDPPWESRVDQAGIRFSSLVQGERLLPFPEQETEVD